MNIIEAIRDPTIFGQAFRNPRTWSAWRSFLAALFALPMDDEQLALYQECTARAAPPTDPVNEAWLVCGRRSGKSFTLALIAVFLSAFRDWRPFLGPGEAATVMIIAADRRQARTIIRYVKGLLKSVPMLAQTIENETAESITLANCVVIEVHSCSFRAVRGYTVVACLADEIAFWTTDEGGANPDIEVLNAVRPAMATVPGAMLLCASSPYARKGALWESYHRHYGQAGGSLIWQAPTRTMNPTVPQCLVDAEVEKDPASAAAEYLAQFRTDIESFVSREAVEACVDGGVLERGPIDGARYAAFVDPAGGSVGGDSFALAITHKEGEISALDCIREVRPPFSPESVIAEFSDLLKTYRISKVKGDRFAGEFPRELFRKQGITYELSEDPKSAIYVNFLPMINSGRVSLLGNQRLIAQLTSLERRTARGGKDSIDHAPHAHDDVANAACGALLNATVRPRQMLVGCQDGSVIYPDGTRRWPGRPEPARIRWVTVRVNRDGNEIKP